MASEVEKEKQMLKSDLYGILDITREATDGEIKKAYRSKARDVHPDRNPSKSAATMFHQIQEAHEWLLDPAKRAKYNIHRDNQQRQNVRRDALDKVIRGRRDDLDRKESEAAQDRDKFNNKMANRKDEIKRMRAEGEKLIEEEQAKYRISKKGLDELARIKLSWDPTQKMYSAKELKNVLGANAVVLSSRRQGRAVAEFENAQMAIAAEFAAKRLYSCPVKIEWLTKPPSNYKQEKATSNPNYTSAQNIQFEHFQEQVLRRCEGF